MVASAYNFTAAQEAQQKNRTESGRYKEKTHSEADVALPTPLLTPGRLDAEAERDGSIHFPPVMNTVGESIEFWTRVEIPDEELNSFYRDLARRDLDRVEKVHRYWTSERVKRDWLPSHPNPGEGASEQELAQWKEAHDSAWRETYEAHRRPTIEQATGRPSLDRRNARTVLRVLLMAETAPQSKPHRDAVMNSAVHLYGVDEVFTVEEVRKHYGPEDIYAAMSEDPSQEQLRSANERLERLVSQGEENNHYTWMAADASARAVEIEIQNGRVRGMDYGYWAGNGPDYLNV